MSMAGRDWEVQIVGVGEYPYTNGENYNFFEGEKELNFDLLIFIVFCNDIRGNIVSKWKYYFDIKYHFL